MRMLYPDDALWVVSDFPPEDRGLKWIQWHQNRSLRDNFAQCRSAVHGRRIRLAGVMLVPGVPFVRMRLAALLLAPMRFIAFNENLNHFMLRLGSLPTLARHVWWRLGNRLRAGKEKPVIQSVPPAAQSISWQGRAATGKPRILVAGCYPIFPLAHGGAVRMYNLMRRAAADFDQVLIVFTDQMEKPSPEVLAICCEVTLVTRAGTHEVPSRGRPDVVEEFDSPMFRCALECAVKKWRPAISQLEFTQMAQYADACAPTRTILVEHYITLDLYSQMLRLETATGGGNGWELKYQMRRWNRFERAAWQNVDRVVTMSERDRQLVGVGAVVIPNGVDLERFTPGSEEPEAGRVLFIGSFAHLPNLIALQFFLRDVWPALRGAKLHVIAGNRPDYYQDFYRDRVQVDLSQPGVELEGFISDVRSAYRKATVVVAPLLASAGTNIKILEAMAMGKAIITTPAGINGLDVTPGTDLLLAYTGAEMAAEIQRLFEKSDERKGLEKAARLTVEREFGWDRIAERQAALYGELIG